MTRLERARRLANGSLLFEIKNGLILGRSILASLALDGYPAKWPRARQGKGK